MITCNCSSSSCLINRYLALRSKYGDDEAVNLLGNILDQLVKVEQEIDEYLFIRNSKDIDNYVVMISAKLVAFDVINISQKKAIDFESLFQKFKRIYDDDNEIIIATDTAFNELVEEQVVLLYEI